MNANRIKQLIRSAIFLPVVFSLSPFALAQSSNTAWTDKLSEQLASDKQCEVAFFTQLVERVKEDKNFYSARAQCVDGRQFDGERLGEKEPFLIEACQVNVC